MKSLISVCFLTLAAASMQAQILDEAKALAREYIKDHLKAPATAVFSSETVCAIANECKEGWYFYRANVDAQNAFGALLRTPFVVEVFTDKSGKLIAHGGGFASQCTKPFRPIGTGGFRKRADIERYQAAWKKNQDESDIVCAEVGAGPRGN